MKKKLVLGAFVLSSFLVLTGCGTSNKIINQARDNIKQAEENIEKAKDDIKVTKDSTSSAKNISVGQTVTTKNFEFTLRKVELGKINTLQINEAVCCGGAVFRNTLYSNFLYQLLIICIIQHLVGKYIFMLMQTLRTFKNKI